MKRMRKNHWSDEQNNALLSLASTEWTNKQALLDKIAKEIPDVDPSRALYHAAKHQNIKYKFAPRKLVGDQLEDAKNMLVKGYDSITVAQHISLKYGIDLSTSYYNKLRFVTRRGEYVVIKDPETGKLVFEHRHVAKKRYTEVHNLSSKKADDKLKGMCVSHPTTFKVNQNDFEDLVVLTRSELMKVSRINQTATALGLNFGELTKHIDCAKLKTHTSNAILSEIFNTIGLDKQAAKLTQPQTPVNEA